MGRILIFEEFKQKRGKIAIVQSNNNEQSAARLVIDLVISLRWNVDLDENLEFVDLRVEATLSSIAVESIWVGLHFHIFTN